MQIGIAIFINLYKWLFSKRYLLYSELVFCGKTYKCVKYIIILHVFHGSIKFLLILRFKIMLYVIKWFLI